MTLNIILRVNNFRKQERNNKNTDRDPSKVPNTYKYMQKQNRPCNKRCIYK